MKHDSKFLKGAGLWALATALSCGMAYAVPAPTNPRLDPGADETVTTAVASPSPTAAAPGGRALFRSNNASLARGLRSGTAESTDVSTMSTAGSSHSKSRYIMSGLVLAALATPLALHHSGEPGDKSVTVETKTPSDPAGSSLPNLGDGGNGKGPGNGGGNNGDDNSGGDNPGGGGSGGGDNGGGDNGGGSGGGGGSPGSGVTDLPEPGTVPLVGAGLMLVLAFRSRRQP